MTLVFVDFQLHGAAPLLHRIGHLLRLFVGAARIVSAREQQQRNPNLINKINRGAVFIKCLVLHWITHRCQVILPQAGILVLDLREPVHEWNNRHACGPHLGGFCDGHHAQVAAVAAAHYDQLLRIDKTAFPYPFARIEHIVQLPAAGIATVGVSKCLAISRRTAIVRRDHEISLVDDVLDEAVERVGRLRRRAAMDVHDRRKLPITLNVVGHVYKSRNRPFPIAAGKVHQIRLDHVGAAQSPHQRMRHLLRLF